MNGVATVVVEGKKKRQKQKMDHSAHRATSAEEQGMHSNSYLNSIDEQHIKSVQELDVLAAHHDLVDDLRHEADDDKALTTKEEIITSVLHNGNDEESKKVLNARTLHPVPCD